ncbi:lipoyl synthase [Desulfosoma caldarium]|uniref:Lipoyl synthase n=1 Tax=Desulfosoma caldarium TaxID=610254 RepID=A0A3N1UV79_9BACT|nr:lipoyl synthase [Desulfosoma caldarium]ROQ91046.1 lipoic acid synthetase [Desulfosoma caldarium]
MPTHDPPAVQTLQKPSWLRKRLPPMEPYHNVRALLRTARVHTVCQEARCPNHWECFSQKTATFLILGDVCTRRCRFCAVRQGRPSAPDPQEPARIAQTVQALGLRYVVITSVTRDDLLDGGASIFAQTIRTVRDAVPGTLVEVLIPDFQGRLSALHTVLQAGPAVLNHNIETVPRLYGTVRPQADYRRSLAVLRAAFAAAPHIPVKSGIMLGLGETDDEILQTLDDLLEAGCRLLTLGQYLQPTPHLHPVARYVTPDAFDTWREKALSMGFRQVASGPWVRSSYHAHELHRRL